jgi:hypothetical protein
MVIVTILVLVSALVVGLVIWAVISGPGPTAVPPSHVTVPDGDSIAVVIASAFAMAVAFVKRIFR